MKYLQTLRICAALNKCGAGRGDACLTEDRNMIIEQCNLVVKLRDLYHTPKHTGVCVLVFNELMADVIDQLPAELVRTIEEHPIFEDRATVKEFFKFRDWLQSLLITRLKLAGASENAL